MHASKNLIMRIKQHKEMQKFQSLSKVFTLHVTQLKEIIWKKYYIIIYSY